MNRFKKIIVLSEFEKDGHPYGLYWCNYVSQRQDKWVLIMRNGNDICVYSHFYKTYPSKCICEMRSEAKEEFLSCLDSNFNVVYLNNFIK